MAMWGENQKVDDSLSTFQIKETFFHPGYISSLLHISSVYSVRNILQKHRSIGLNIKLGNYRLEKRISDHVPKQNQKLVLFKRIPS